MGTVIRAELSRKNQWWIPKHRYYELKHFCMQYPDWKRWRRELGELSISSGLGHAVRMDPAFGRPTETLTERMTYFDQRIELVEKAAKLVDDVIGAYILQAVTLGKSYDILYLTRPIPCCRDSYYELYRKFFYILDGLRE